MVNLKPQDRIIVALDMPLFDALSVAQKLKGKASFVKVGMSLFFEAPYVVSLLKDAGFKVFLDLKLNDIPHQLSLALEKLAHYEADLLTLHGFSGPSAIKACKKVKDALHMKTKLLAVTILTSMNQSELELMGLGNKPVISHVEHLASISVEVGADGVICSPHEITVVRETFISEKQHDALIVTPGIRPSWAQTGDQKRIMTPAEALEKGADYLVIGRPITQAEDPISAFERVVEECLEHE